MLKRVGKAKSGWPILQSGNKAPKWIMEHPGGGIWKDETANTEKPSITFGNNRSFIQGTGAELRITQRVINNRIHNMKSVIERTLKREADKRQPA